MVKFKVPAPPLPDMTPQAWLAGYEAAGPVIVADIQKNFIRQGYEDPPGVFHHWQPLSPLTLALSLGQAGTKVSTGVQKSARVRRSGQSQILRNTGALMASINFKATSDGIIIGSSLNRGGYNILSIHEDGATIHVTQKMRYYLWITSGVWITAQVIRIPRRPILRLSEQGSRIMVRAFAHGVEQWLKRKK